MNVAKDPDLEYSLRSHVEALANGIGDRSVQNYEKLRSAAKYIEGQLMAFGYSPEPQYYSLPEFEVKNIIATKTGSTKPDEIIVVGAHYDTRDNPGADDNASGVAGMLEMAKFMAPKESQRTIQFIGFTNEEPPYFQTTKMGSRVYTGLAKQRDENIKVALILEMIGYYSDEPKSQMYPPLLSLFYPSKGNFIAFIGNLDSRSLVKTAVYSFREYSKFPIEWISSIWTFTGFDFSDHWSFWEEGYPAFMITDTAFYRNSNYHKNSDTAETLNFEKMAEVVQGLRYMLLDIANE